MSRSHERYYVSTCPSLTAPGAGRREYHDIVKNLPRLESSSKPASSRVPVRRRGPSTSAVEAAGVLAPHVCIPAAALRGAGCRGGGLTQRIRSPTIPVRFTCAGRDGSILADYPYSWSSSHRSTLTRLRGALNSCGSRLDLEVDACLAAIAAQRSGGPVAGGDVEE